MRATASSGNGMKRKKRPKNQRKTGPGRSIMAVSCAICAEARGSMGRRLYHPLGNWYHAIGMYPTRVADRTLEVASDHAEADRRAVAAVLAGDRQAFRPLVERHQR